MTNKQYVKSCLIYCRVSSKRQVEEGNGLGSQEKRCRNYAFSKGYKVEKVFEEKGVSGALFDRPAMKELISFLDKNAHKEYVIIFDDLKRFARDYSVHLKLKMELVEARGATLECLNFNFENTPEGEFVEGILALQGELERKQNRRQVIQKQKARLERGFWPFCPPPQFKHIKSKQHGKILVSREPMASISKEALERYAKNLLNTQHEVKDFLNEEYKKHGLDRRISIHGVQKLLSTPLNAGYVEYKPWEISLSEGQHEGIISIDIHHVIQDKLAGRSKPKFNKSCSTDFPLRRFVTCSKCGSKLRASWNTGNGGKYPNYWCQNKDCEYRYKVTKAWDIHTKFEAVLKHSKATKGARSLATAIFNDVWETEKQRELKNISSLKDRMLEIDKELETLAKRSSQASSEKVVSVYEQLIEKLSNERDHIGSGDEKPKLTENKFGTCLNRVYDTLENPLLLWHSDNLEDQRTVLYMYFENGLDFDYKKGFGTYKFSEAINLLRDPANAEFPNVEMSGNEPESEKDHQLGLRV